jgi:hypothetical protein
MPRFAITYSGAGMANVSVERHDSRAEARRAAVSTATSMLLAEGDRFQQGAVDCEVRHEVTGRAERFRVTLSVQRVA